MRNRLILLVMGTAICVSLPTSDFAKAAPVKELEDYTVTGSRIRIKPTDLGDRQRNLAITNFSRCLVGQATPRVNYYLRNSDALASKENPQKFFPMGECLGEAMGDADQSQARFSMLGLRGWLAEAAYLKANKKYVAFAPDAPPASPRQYFSIDGNLRLAKRIGEFSDCIVARDPAGADAILRTSRGSAAEFEAAKPFLATLSACIDGKSEVSFNSETLRAYVADGLWQRYEAGKPSTFKGGN